MNIYLLGPLLWGLCIATLFWFDYTGYITRYWGLRWPFYTKLKKVWPCAVCPTTTGGQTFSNSSRKALKLTVTWFKPVQGSVPHIPRHVPFLPLSAVRDKFHCNLLYTTLFITFMRSAQHSKHSSSILTAFMKVCTDACSWLTFRWTHPVPPQKPFSSS